MQHFVTIFQISPIDSALIFLQSMFMSMFKYWFMITRFSIKFGFMFMQF